MERESRYFSPEIKKTEPLLRHAIKRKCASNKNLAYKPIKPSIPSKKTFESKDVISKQEPEKNISHELNSYCNDEIETCNFKLPHLYYEKPCIELAKNLLGKLIVRKLANGEIVKGKITETECYLGVIDKACHCYGGKVTERNSAMFMIPGTAYVYSIYGMYYCLNISSQEEGSAVLIRSLEPISGISAMHELRTAKKSHVSRTLKLKELCNGPSKLCLALNITKELFNKVDLTLSSSMWLENETTVPNSEIVVSTRIGIKSAGEEWASKPLRFYIKNNNFVSVRDKTAEKELNNSQPHGINIS